MTTDKLISIDTHVDTLGIRCEFNKIENRDDVFNQLVSFVAETKVVGMQYDSRRSSKYYQSTKLVSGNSTLASVAKGHYTKEYDRLNPECFYINMSFYGLMRYNTVKDDASLFLVRTISAYLNTCKISFRLTEVDIAMDINTKIDNVLALCRRRTSNIDYFQLGDKDVNGTAIQEYEGTYNIEKFKSYKQKKHAMSRAYIYNKRKKEKDKFNRDIGFELTRFELKLQKRYFVKNEYTGSSMYKAMQKYSVFYFADKKEKELFIQRYNSANTSKKRNKVLDVTLESKSAVPLTYRLNKVYSFLREIDSITFDSQGNFKYVKHEDYLYCQSKFNRKY